MSNQVAQGGEFAPLTDYLYQLAPGELVEIADQLDVLGKDTQAATLRRMSKQRAIDALTEHQRMIAERSGLGVERYVAAMTKWGQK